MTLCCGIVGLPNVGKSTLFNALMGSKQAKTGNYPFCTIKENVGIVPLIDKRLHHLAKLEQTQRTTYAYLEFTDIAGLVEGAATGKGMGNQFLDNIRQVDAVIHLLRCFEDSEVQHVAGVIDPISDLKTINLELALADLKIIDKHLFPARKKTEPIVSLDLLRKAKAALESENLSGLSDKDKDELKPLALLMLKPVIYVCNVAEEHIKSGSPLTKLVDEYLINSGASPSCRINCLLEAEISLLSSEEERISFLKDLGLTSSGLQNIAHTAYKKLNLLTFLTSGRKEVRAWTIKQGTTAQGAAGKIHSDIENNFIRAEIVTYEQYLECKGWDMAHKKGISRFEGKDYIMQENDVVLFHHS